jgi:uncharacterized membrane protein YsdA (DUF1294 family)/cold shock CspA family protein
MQLSGTVVFWRDDKGFGFVVCEQNQEKLFFHIRDLATGNARPQPGDQLQFSITQDKQGRDIAAPWQFITPKTALISDPPPHRSTDDAADIRYANHIALLFRLSFLIAVAIALLYGRLLYVLPLLYIEASLFTYWLYKADKEAAIARHGNRLAEESLQLFSLIGGWPGAYIAQRQLAHKRSKIPFRREFGFVILGNALLVIWLLSPWGEQFLARMALFTG